MLARQQSLAAEGLEAIRRRLPMPLLAIDCDNDSAFINDALVSYSRSQKLEFTRSRACRKNDQAWIEQKNGAVIRKFAGYERLTGAVTAQCPARLFQAMRLYVNYFQPSFKLRSKTGDGAKTKEVYDKPMTPCDRLLNNAGVADAIKAGLRVERERLDPLDLLHRIRESQSALAAMGESESGGAGPARESIEQFLAKLPKLWREGEARPTHRAKRPSERSYRTRNDPFEGVWREILTWLQIEPEASAKSLLARLDQKHPGRFPKGQLRTLQRRIRDWRRVMARELVYAGGDRRPASAPVVIGFDQRIDESETRQRNDFNSLIVRRCDAAASTIDSYFF